MILTVVIAKQSNSVTLQNCLQMSTNDLSGFAIAKRMKLRDIVGNQITALAGIKRKLLIRKVG